MRSVQGPYGLQSTRIEVPVRDNSASTCAGRAFKTPLEQDLREIGSLRLATAAEAIARAATIAQLADREAEDDWAAGSKSTFPLPISFLLSAVGTMAFLRESHAAWSRGNLVRSSRGSAGFQVAGAI